MKRLFLFFVLLPLLGRAADKPDLIDGIAVLVNDAVITYEDIERGIGAAAEVLLNQYGAQSDLFQKKLAALREDMTKQLVERQLILDDFKTLGYKLPESFIDDSIQGRIREKFGDRLTLTKTLQSQGITYEEFRRQEGERIIVNFLREKNIPSDLVISPQKIENYYQEHASEYQLEDQVKLRLLVLNQQPSEPPGRARKLAQDILLKLKEGTAFAEMASLYSEGSQRGQGGDWGWVERKVPKKGLGDVAFALKKGETSGVVRLLKREDGSYLVYHCGPGGEVKMARSYTKDDALSEEKPPPLALNEEPPAGLTEEIYLMLAEDVRASYRRPISEVHEEIEKNLLAQEKARLQKKYIDRLTKKAFVRYF